MCVCGRPRTVEEAVGSDEHGPLPACLRLKTEGGGAAAYRSSGRSWYLFVSTFDSA